MMKVVHLKSAPSKIIGSQKYELASQKAISSGNFKSMMLKL